MKTVENRKTATKLLLINWSRFQKAEIRLEGSTLITGVNGSGKTTILDAMTYLLTGNVRFNTAANDRDRTVKSYVRGDTRASGSDRYLRPKGTVISYIVMEFYSPVEEMYLLTGVCLESADVESCKPYWFVMKNVRMDDVNFYTVNGDSMTVTPRNKLNVRGSLLKTTDFMVKEKGVPQLLRMLGLRLSSTKGREELRKYRSKLVRMMAFDPDNHVDKFISDCVLDAGDINSLEEIKKQREVFDNLRGTYDNLKQSKDILERVEGTTRAYEDRMRLYNSRYLMLKYQNLRFAEDELSKCEHTVEMLGGRYKLLESEMRDADRYLKEAEDRKSAADANFMNSDFTASKVEYEKQIDRNTGDRQHIEEGRDKLVKLGRKLEEFMEWGQSEPEMADIPADVLTNISTDRYDGARKTEVFTDTCIAARILKDRLSRDRIHLEDDIGRIEKETAETERNIKQLEANKLVLPDYINAAKKKLAEGLRQHGIKTEVRTFAELVVRVKDESWRRAIETFLGNKRYDIIVESRYCREAMSIVQSEKLYGAHLVMTDQLPRGEVSDDSAAAQLEYAGGEATRYAAFLLGGIKLCETLDELHDNPRGGLMRDGMLAKGYRVTMMDMRKTRYCLGEESIKLQLGAFRKQKEELAQEGLRLREELDAAVTKISHIDSINWNSDDYAFDAVERLAGCIARIKELTEKLEELKSNPDYMKLFEEQSAAAEQHEQAKASRDRINAELATVHEKIESENRRRPLLDERIQSLRHQYEEYRNQYPELEEQMLSDYEKNRSRNADGHAITEKQVNKLRAEVDNMIKAMEDAQLDYQRCIGGNQSIRGVSCISYFREQYRNIANIEIERTREKLEEQRERLSSVFMQDFVAEINEQIQTAKDEVKKINAELRRLPFGHDTYEFKVGDRKDRQQFFDICRKLEEYGSNYEFYKNVNPNDDEMDTEIREFMDMVLAEEDDSEYTDYRKYLTYDMKIISKQGSESTETNLSEKQGSASNGEKQTPYFIILAASLMQYYPASQCCERMAFIDEAFSALSLERIEQMVRYLEDNHFQVIYAAPPEKINSIGSHIDNTTSIVTGERYSYVIDGLVKAEE